MKKQFWVYGFLTLIALSSGLIADWFTPKTEIIPSAASHRPDSFSEKFTKTVMNLDGTPNNRLSAESMIHFSDDKSTELKKPILVFFDEDQPPWTVRSETGRVSSNGKSILLGGSVFISRPAGPGVRPIEIITKNLTVKPKENTAETDEFAELTSLSNRISGIGVNVNFGQIKKVTLHSNVRGKYEKP